MRIVFHGSNAETFLRGFEAYLEPGHQVDLVSDGLDGEGESEAFEAADVVVGVALSEHHPVPKSAKLYQAPAAGVDKIDMARLPEGASVCNAFGHEGAIAEYVMAALLARHVPLGQADEQLRQGDWTYWAGKPTGLRSELSSQTIGILGFGHIGKAIAKAAKAFGMGVTVCNRSAPDADAGIDHAFPLSELSAFMGSADIIIATLPLTDQTEGLIAENALASMRDGAVIMNVGRGPVIDEAALFAALSSGRIDGVIDTWYVYPTGDEPNPAPSRFPFETLRNVVMTPHMSAWTFGTIERRQKTIAENVRRLAASEELVNIVARR
ncbi:MAG: phosphoglycerate dehydrogenase [Fulvimarina manganoxydans]|uniref:2-hydroxyacid dehydrogenase n=1 Tax=Fulvimarina manganoxydans TaxID=937218 RepID=UPI0023576D89|nr:2-hydroxyacid dehydrogenase [Fulvimarina manganoxydans]MCK5933069.1 phosphoglycerate dehydrogenase [Fulvimarina manganoxydans]